MINTLLNDTYMFGMIYRLDILHDVGNEFGDL